jgi:Domain of unknown function (DUF927)
MTDWNAVSAFMGAVVPWPASPQDAGWVVMPNGYPDKNTKDGRIAKTGKFPIGQGRAFKTIDEFVNFAGWAVQQHFYKDLFYCLSLQRDVTTSRSGKPKGKRTAAGAISLKSIWLDIDVGKKDGYPTLQEALRAVIDFVQRNKLPMPSAMVASGGGLHVYWISNVALTPEEWRPYAEGLKALASSQFKSIDIGVTTDPARILRVPGTFNHKEATPRPCYLLNTPLVCYDFSVRLASLPAVTPLSPSTKSATNQWFDPVVFRGVTPILRADPNDKLGAGIDQYSDDLLDPRPIFKDCGFYRDALKDGGKDYDQQLWMYSILGTTFMEGGRVFAHEISKGHATYSPSDTDAMFDRKLGERADRGLGYPSCAAIAGAGCKACQTCPLFSKGKSPLNLRPAAVVTVTVNQTQPQSPSAQGLDLPEGYDIDNDGHIVKVIEKPDREGNMITSYHKLFLSKLSKPWAQGNPDAINLITSYDKGNEVQASLKWADFGATNISNIMALQKIKIKPDNKRYLEEFLVSWLGKLHTMSTVQQPLPFGWYREQGKVKGFAYGGTLFKDDNTEQNCGHGDVNLRKIFSPVGSLQKWFDAERVITNQKRPELDAIITLSFSAPLMSLVGLNAATLSCFGESGAGKSSAYSVGIGVWGHSKKGKATSHSTFNQVMKTMGEINNLPFYWDEIKDPKAQAAVYDYIYNASDGVEKGRLKSDTSQQDRGTWQTQMMLAANISFVDYVMTRDTSHVAGASRVLEYPIAKLTGDRPGRISSTDANVIIDELANNYGHMGLLYAKHLALNHASIAAECRTSCQQVETELQMEDPERFWVGLVGTLLVGARHANLLGANLGLEDLKTFLYDVYLANRKKRNELMQVTGDRKSIENIMTSYFDAKTTHDQMLWTKGMPNGPGRPSGDGKVSVIHQPKDSKNVSVKVGIAVRWDLTSRKCYIHKTDFIDFLNEAGAGSGTVLNALSKDYGMVIHDRLRIGAGVFDAGRATLCVFDINADHEWAHLMYRYTPENERPTPTDPVKDEVAVETGLEIDAATGLATTTSVQSFVRGATAGAH